MSRPDHHTYPLPGRLNLVIAGLQLAALVGLLWAAGRVTGGWALLAVALGYGLVMNSAYALLHEAEHNLLHPDRRLNLAVGVVLALFFPAPFHLLRQGHLGHHVRNRSDDEAFDFYFEGESVLWKHLQFYGILTGFFWVMVVASNLLALLIPGLLKPKSAAWDRPTAALLETLNPRFESLVRLEAAAVLGLHVTLNLAFAIPVWSHLAVLAGFGVSWSALQYVHHYGTERDVLKGAMNLRTFAPLDLLLLNHNWHLNHHLSPTVPWLYLPFVQGDPDEPRGGLVRAYLRMWKGPRFTDVRIKNRHAGKIIR